MGFADRYIHALSASNLKDDERHHQAEPLLAAAFAAAEVSGDLGPLLHRVKFAGTTARNMAHAAAARERAEKGVAEAIRAKDVHREADCRQALAGDAVESERSVALLAQLLRLWTAEVTKRGRARKWIKEDTTWNVDAAMALYRQVAEASLAHWLDSTCKTCNGTTINQHQQCRACKGTGNTPIEHNSKLVEERAKDMVSELQGIVDSHAARAASKLRHTA